MADLCTLGWQVAHWVETMLVHGPGDVEGEQIELDIDDMSVFVRAYELWPRRSRKHAPGRRKVRRYYKSAPKGFAKSELAGFLALAEAVAPVRFSHWAVAGETSWWGYEYEKGEPVGRPVQRPFVRCLATEETQSANTYGNVYYILTHEDALILGEYPGFDVGLTRTFLPERSGEIRPSSASSAAKDGGKETFAVFDETHLYTLPELHDMHRVVRRNLTKRKGAEPWSLDTTTAYEVGRGSVAEVTMKHYLDGDRQAAWDVVVDHREGPDPDNDFDWEDDDQLVEAMKVAYGPKAGWQDFQAKVLDARDPESEKMDSIRFYLNRASSSENDVVTQRQWETLARPGEVVADGESITLGFDGSKTDDSTGIVGCRGSDGLKFRLGLWEKPPDANASWRVPRLEVRAAVKDIFETYDVVMMYGDDEYWETDFNEWMDRYGDDRVKTIPQSDKRLWYMSRRFATNVRNAVQFMEQKEAAAEPTFSDFTCHDGNPDIARHVRNAIRYRMGGRIGNQGAWRPAKRKPHLKIDLLMASVFADEARGDAIKSGKLTEHKANPLANIW